MQNRGMGLGAQCLGCGGRVQYLTAPAGIGQRSCCREGWGGSPKGSWLEVCVKGVGGEAGQDDVGASRGSVSVLSVSTASADISLA